MKLRISELDALRGIAALSVVLFHFLMPWQTWTISFLGIFSMGVDLFFVISGFVICMSIRRGSSITGFIRNRFIRLYPAYWACVTITTLLFVMKYTCIVPAEHSRISSALLRQYLANMTMFQYYLGFANMDGPYWTLIVELCFYAAMIVLMALRRLDYIIPIGFVFAAFSTCYAIPAVFQHQWLHRILIAFPLIGYAPLFLAGIVLYHMKSEKVTIVNMLIFISTLVFQSLLFSHCYENKNFVNIYQYCGTLTFIYTVFTLFLFDKLGFIINPVTLWLGRISYSLYLIHQFVGIRILVPRMIDWLHFDYWLAAPLSLSLVLLLAYAIHAYIELPAMSYLRRKSPVMMPAAT